MNNLKKYPINVKDTRKLKFNQLLYNYRGYKPSINFNYII